MNHALICPLARKTDLTIEELPSEMIVYDHLRNRMHCLNRSASFIWRRCDGQTEIGKITAQLPEVSLPADLDVVRRALKDLERVHLLEGAPAFAGSELLSRRTLVQRLGLAAGAAASVLPVITSAVAPTPAMAKSGDKHDKDKKPKKEKKSDLFFHEDD
jgi:hypothetical protein